MIEKEVVPYWEIDELADEFTRLFQKAVEDKNRHSAEYFHDCRSCLETLKAYHTWKYHNQHLEILKAYHTWKYDNQQPQFETTSAER